MKKPNDWESAPAYTGEASAQLPKGGYVLIIKAAKVENTQNYGEKLHILFDIAEGDFKGFVQTKYDKAKAESSNPKDVKWPAVGRYNTFVTTKDGATNGWFKGLITSIEKSNNYVFDWKENSLVGKLVGGLFVIDEFMGKDDKIIPLVKMVQARSVDVIRSGAYELPEDRLIERATQTTTPEAKYTEEDPEDLPF
jgi:hypothetical protein